MNNLAAGTVLISEPFMKDPNFARSVVLLCKYSEEDGAFGFCINRSTEFTVGELIQDLDGINFPVYQGGPVANDTLHFVHTYPQLIPDSYKVTDDIYWGGDFETAKLLLLEGSLEPDKIKFFLGYSGWDKGQLEGEMTEKSWLVGLADAQILFTVPTQEVWKQSLLQLGPEYKMVVNYPTDPQLN